MPRKTAPRFSDQLRNAIAQCGMTRYVISRETGIDQAVLSRFMHGKSGLSIDALDRLGACLQITINVERTEHGVTRQKG